MIHPSRKAKIKWQCRRGMLELDLMLNQFIDQELDNLTETQFSALEELLANSDPMLYHWLMGNDCPENKEVVAIVDLIKMQNNTR